MSVGAVHDFRWRAVMDSLPVRIFGSVTGLPLSTRNQKGAGEVGIDLHLLLAGWAIKLHWIVKLVTLTKCEKARRRRTKNLRKLVDGARVWGSNEQSGITAICRAGFGLVVELV